MKTQKFVEEFIDKQYSTAGKTHKPRAPINSIFGKYSELLGVHMHSVHI